MRINKQFVILLITVLIGGGLIFSFRGNKQQNKKPAELKEEKQATEKTEEKQVCIEGLSWGFRGVEYKMTGWENHELAGKTKKLCCGISKQYEDTIYKACVYDEEYILWIKSPYTNNEFRRETVGYKKEDKFCKISYDYYQPGEKIVSEDCYSENE